MAINKSNMDIILAVKKNINNVAPKIQAHSICPCICSEPNYLSQPFHR